MALEPALAGLLTLVGVGLTSFAEVSHVSQAIAPGATLAFFGALWLGNSLARRRPFPSEPS